MVPDGAHGLVLLQDIWFIEKPAHDSCKTVLCG
jgi:hypothetical protein